MTLATTTETPTSTADLASAATQRERSVPAANAAPATAPLVTIGMPVYNGERHMRAALESLLAQDYSNFELVISENGSTDATRDICREYASRDPRVRVHHQPQHISAIENFTSVLALARGEYFMWAAVDDLWYPAFVREAAEELDRNPDAGVAMSAVDRIWDTGEAMDQIRFVGRDDINGKGYYKTIKACTSPKKYNLFVYGLFRTELLRGAMQVIPQVPNWDRLLVCQVALAAPLRYIDQVLHTRTNHRKPSHVRLPDEPFNRMTRMDPWVEAKTLGELARMLVRSPVIPWPRKAAFAPLVLSRYGWLLLRGRLMPELKQRFGPALWDRLAPLRRLVVRR
jgi:hypothetical protein